MCDNGKYFFYFIKLINCNIFGFHYLLLKEPKLQKRANKYSKTRCKNESKKLT